MDTDKILIDQNYVLGEIKESIRTLSNLQTIANGRTSKIEEKVVFLQQDNAETIKFISSYEADKHDKRVENNQRKMITYDRVISFISAVLLAFLTYILGKNGKIW